jgi:hypothetical protein
MANTAQSKRRPWPYDAIINGVPVMLSPGEDGNLVAQKSRTLDATAPTTFEYSSSNPAKERTFPWTKLYGGLGQGREPDERPRRYRYTQRVDGSINGLWMLGPKFETHIETINASAGEVRQILTGPYNGSEIVFAICENGVYGRVSDGVWTPLLTGSTVPALAAGENPTNAVRFRDRTTLIDALYLGTDTGNLWQFNSTTLAFSQAVAAQGPGVGAVQGEARYLERVGDELWVAGDYWVMKAEVSPMLRVSWSAPIYIGDQSSKITFLKQINNTLFIFKTDGIYTLSEAGLDQDLFPHFRTRRLDSNGKNSAVWMNRMWVPYGDQTYIIDEGGNIEPDGLAQILQNDSDVKGTAVGAAGHNTWFFYEVYYNSSTATSYLVKHGTWVEGSDLGALQEGEYAQVHHGAIAQWAKQASTVAVISNVHASGNDRLYVGFTNGTVEWCVLPRSSPNPAEDPNCEFTNLEAYLYLPVHHMGFEADNKLYMGITVPANYLSSTEWATVEYKLDVNPLASWIALEGDITTFTVPGQRIDFPTDGPTYSKEIEIRVKLSKDPSLAASPANRTPILEGVVVHQAIRPSLALEYVASVRASSFLPKHNGTVDRRRGVQIKDLLLEAAAEPGVLLVTFADGGQQEVTITDYKESWASYEKRRDLDYVIQLEMIQYRTISHNRVFSGLTYATLETYTLGQLEAII